MPLGSAGVRSLAVAFSLAVLAGSSAGTAHAVVSPGSASEITLPPLYGDQLPQVNFFAATASGFAWELDQPDEDPLATAYYTSYSGGGTRVHSTVGNVNDLALSDSELTGEAAGNGSLASVDINTGQRRVAHCTPTAYDDSGDNECVGFSGDVTSATMTNTETGSSTTFTLPALPPGYTVSPRGVVRSMDAGGAIVLVDATTSAMGAARGELLYLDFASGKTVVLDGDNTSESDRIAMDDSTVAWSVGYHQVDWIDRSDPTAAPSQLPTSAALVGVAVSGGNLGYSTSSLADPDGNGGTYVIHTGPLSTDPSTYGAVPNTYGAVETGRDGNFLVFAGTTVSDYGAYALAAGSDTFGAPAVLFGPTAPLSIEASAGRIISVLPDGGRAPADQRRVTSNRADSRLTASRSTPLVHRLIASVAPASSGAETAYLRRLADGSCELDVLTGGTVVGRYPVPVTCFHVTLSGNLALVTYDQQYVDDGVPDKPPGSVLVNLVTGSSTKEPETEALSGDLLAYFGNGDINIKDIATRTVQHLEPGELPGLPDFQPDGDDALSIAGRWVLVSYNDQSDTDRLVAIDLATMKTVQIPGAAMMDSSDAVLADGVAAWIDADTRAVHLDQLSDTGVTDTTIGTAHDYASGHDYLAVTDEFVAWVANDDTTRVLALSGASSAAPAFLDGVRTRSFTPARSGHRGDFLPHFAVTRPLAKWRLALTRHGHTVRVLRGSAPVGAVQPRWNGRTASGRRLPAGAYTWRLTGRGPTGRLHAKPGTTGPSTGTVHLHWRHRKA